jgi:hypothetical protein
MHRAGPSRPAGAQRLRGRRLERTGLGGCEPTVGSVTCGPLPVIKRNRPHVRRCDRDHSAARPRTALGEQHSRPGCRRALGVQHDGRCAIHWATAAGRTTQRRRGAQVGAELLPAVPCVLRVCAVRVAFAVTRRHSPGMCHPRAGGDPRLRHGALGSRWSLPSTTIGSGNDTRVPGRMVALATTVKPRVEPPSPQRHRRGGSDGLRGRALPPTRNVSSPRRRGSMPAPPLTGFPLEPALDHDRGWERHPSCGTGGHRFKDVRQAVTGAAQHRTQWRIDAWMQRTSQRLPQPSSASSAPLR